MGKLPKIQSTVKNKAQPKACNAKARTRTPSYGDDFYDDIGAEDFDQLQYNAGRKGSHDPPRFNPSAQVATYGSDIYGDDDSLLGDAMIGLADSQALQSSREQETIHAMERAADRLDLTEDFHFESEDFDDDFDMNVAGLDEEYFDQAAAHASQARTTATSSKAMDETDGSRVYQHGNYAGSHDHKSIKHQYPRDGTHSMVDDSGTEQQQTKSMFNMKLLPVDPREDVENEPDHGPESATPDVPDAFKDLEPWLFQEFGGIVELVDE